MKTAVIAALALVLAACSSGPSDDEIATETAVARESTADAQSTIDATSTALAAPTQQAIQTRQAESQATARAISSATASAEEARAQQIATRTAAAGVQRTATASAPTATPTATATPTPEPTATPTPGPRTEFGNGTHIVGTDIAPGTYRSNGEDGCYWARLSGFGGTTSEIIANSFARGPQVVTILPSDAGFESSRCGRWTILQ